MGGGPQAFRTAAGCSHAHPAAGDPAGRSTGQRRRGESMASRNMPPAAEASACCGAAASLGRTARTSPEACLRPGGRGSFQRARPVRGEGIPPTVSRSAGSRSMPFARHLLRVTSDSGWHAFGSQRNERQRVERRGVGMCSRGCELEENGSGIAGTCLRPGGAATAVGGGSTGRRHATQGRRSADARSMPPAGAWHGHPHSFFKERLHRVKCRSSPVSPTSSGDGIASSAHATIARASACSASVSPCRIDRTLRPCIRSTRIGAHSAESQPSRP